MKKIRCEDHMGRKMSYITSDAINIVKKARKKPWKTLFHNRIEFSYNVTSRGFQKWTFHVSAVNIKEAKKMNCITNDIILFLKNSEETYVI